MQPRISISVSCYGRPERTKRIIECIGKQSINEWEALIVGDCCPDFQKLLESEWYQDWIKEVESRGNKVISYNLPTHNGGHGYHITNQNIQSATGKYFIFVDNDDYITPGHCEHYLRHIENTPFNFIWFNVLVVPNNNSVRWSHLKFGQIGHAELIIKTDFLKTMPPHGPEYGHDWALIENMKNAAGMYKKAESTQCTYHVMSIPGSTADTID